MAKTTIQLTAQDQTKAAFDSVERALDRLDKAAKLIGVSLSVGAFAEFVKHSIDAADEMGKLSQKVGISVEALSGLKYASDLSNVGVETLTTGLGKLSSTLLQAATGGREQSATLRALGVDMAALKAGTLTTDQAFGQIAKRVGTMADGWQKTALLQSALGKGAKDLIPLLNDNADGFESVRKEAEELGIVITQELADSAERFNDNVTRLKAGATGLGLSIANDLLPALNDIAIAFLKLQQQQDGSTSFFENLGKGLRLAAVAAGSFYLALKDMGDGIGALMAQAAALATGNLDAVKAIGKERDEQYEKNKRQFEEFQQSLLNPSAAAPLKRPRTGTPDIEDLKVEKSGLRKFIEEIERETEKLNNSFDPILQQVNDKWLKVFQLAREAGISIEDAGNRAAPAIEAYKEALVSARDETRVFEEETRRAQDRIADWADAFNFTDGVRDQIEDIQLQTRLLTESREQQDLVTAVTKFDNEQKKIAIGLEGERRVEFEKTAAVLRDQFIAAFEGMQDAQRSWQTGYLSALNEVLDRSTNTAQQVHDVFTGAFERLEDLWVEWAKTGKASARDLADFVITQLLKIQAQQLIIAPIANALSNAGASAGLGALFGFFGASNSPSGATSYGPISSGGIPRAAGGAVNPGMSYWVGEQGPEMFTPSVGGTITSSGGSGVHIEQLNIAPGADPAAVEEAFRQIRDMKATIGPTAVAAVASARQRGAAGLR